jgi:hypothetical protein
MANLKDSVSSLATESGGWRRWVGSLIFFGVALVATFFIVTSFFPGDTFMERLENSYQFLWENTTRVQFTDIMRENPWVFIIPGVSIILVTGILLPFKHWARALLVYVTFALGFIAGHVFW